MIRRDVLSRLAVACFLSCSSFALFGQASPAATGPGGFVSVGGMLSDYRSPYGKQRLAGGSFYVDANLSRWLGLEGEGRVLSVGAAEGSKASTYLVGPRISTNGNRFRPYAKILLGRGEFTFPFGYAKGSYFVIAPGAGVDVSLFGGRAFFRVVDFEYQDWRDFTFGQNHPYGFSTGVSVRLPKLRQIVKF